MFFLLFSAIIRSAVTSWSESLAGMPPVTVQVAGNSGRQMAQRRRRPRRLCRRRLERLGALRRRLLVDEVECQPS